MIPLLPFFNPSSQIDDVPKPNAPKSDECIEMEDFKQPSPVGRAPFLLPTIPIINVSSHVDTRNEPVPSVPVPQQNSFQSDFVPALSVQHMKACELEMYLSLHFPIVVNLRSFTEISMKFCTNSSMITIMHL